jgi:hypothetical protein
MATEKIVFETEVKTGNSGTSVKSLKSELKDLTKTLGSLEAGSEAFNNAAKRAGQLKEQIRGVNDAIENADPEKKFAPFSRTIQGLAGGFAAAQGAMALFGSESKDLEKTLVKVQGAMALSQGLNSLLEFKNDFKELGTTIIKNVVKAFTTLRGALIATGIGALAVTVGLLIVNWEKFSEAITKAFPSFKVVTDFFKNIRQFGVGAIAGIVEGFTVLGEVVSLVFQRKFSEAVAVAKTFGTRIATETNKAYAEEDRKVKLENSIKDRDFALKLEEAKGKDVKAKRLQLLKDELSLLKKGGDEYNAKLLEIETLKTEIRQDAIDKQKKIDEGNAQYAAEATKRLDELKEKDKKNKKSNDEYAKLASDKLAADARKGFNESEKQYDAAIKKEKELASAKREALQMTATALGQYSDALGKETAAGKALAAAQALIDTYLAASSVFTNVTQNPYMKLLPDGGLTVAIGAAAAAVVGGLARVKAIYAVKVPGGSGGGGGAGAAPSVPQFNPAVAQQVQGGGDVQLGMKPQKVYVVESDIRGTMNKVDVIEANATIG